MDASWPGPHELIKDVQKTLQALVEDENSKGFEESFVYGQITALLHPVENISASSDSQKKLKTFPIKNYPKLSKFLRILIIMMLQTSAERCNQDEVVLAILGLLNQLSVFFKFQEPVPFD